MKLHIIILLPILIYIGCERKSNDEIISKIKENYSKSKEEYYQAMGKIVILNISDTCYFYYFSRVNTISFIHYKTNESIENMPESSINFLNTFMRKNQCSIMAYVPNFIKFNFSDEKNRNGDVVSLINHLANKVNYKELYPEFEIYDENHIPEKAGGWIYILEDGWIIYSPIHEEKPMSLMDIINSIFVIVSISLTVIIILYQLYKFFFTR